MLASRYPGFVAVLATARRAVSRPLAAMRFTVVAALLVAGGTGRDAVADYDLDTLGIPRFVNTVYIDLPKITRISKFRSYVGHDYSDQRQFGNDGIRDSRNRTETCRSMKHYFIAPDETINIYAPVTGTISNVTPEFLGFQIEIRADQYPDFRFIIFHVGLTPMLSIGERVTAGQRLGTHGGSATWSDIAVWVQTPRGKHLVSYLETLTDEAFAPFLSRGMTARSDAVIAKEARDAEPVQCPGFSNPANSEFFNFTGGAATQTISLGTAMPSVRNVGDAPLALKPTATSGLPVTVSSSTPKVCGVLGDVVTPRRPGVCQLTLTQAGNATTFAAPPLAVNSTVYAAGASIPGRPRLGRILPPSSVGPQSYLRFYNGGLQGTVRASLLDGATGQSIATWTSPPISSGASLQVSVAELESAAPAGFVRPASYGLKIENETTANGLLQHVVFDPNAGALLNYSTCDTGVVALRDQLMNVHTSRLNADYPTTLVISNYTTSPQGAQLRINDAKTGNTLGFYFGSSIAANGAQTIDIDTLEANAQPQGSTTKVRITPGAADFHYALRDTGISNNFRNQGYYVHLIDNRRAGVISDMTTACTLSGLSEATIPALLRTASVFSGTQAAAQSFLRFYNSGVTAGPVEVKLYDAKTGQSFGPWTSQSLAPGTSQQVPVASIESALGLSGRESYTVSVQTGIDGLFQHVLWRAPDGALSNASTCSESVTADPRTLIAVHSSVMGRAGYPSTIVVNNAGLSPMAATLTLHDARDGTPLGSYKTPVIPANAHVTLDVGAIEIAAQMSPGAAMVHYVAKADDGFTGFLQHLVRNQSAGVTTDMTTVCMM